MKRIQINETDSILFSIGSIPTHVGFGFGIWRTDYGQIILWTICLGPLTIYINQTTKVN